jgi:hypothetical protein
MGDASETVRARRPASSSPTMETLTNARPRYGFVPPTVMEFFEGGYRRARVCRDRRERVVAPDADEDVDFFRDDEDGEDATRDARDVRRLRREVEWDFRRRGPGTWYEPADDDPTWTRVRGYEFGDALPESWSMDAKEESEVARRERACANRLMDLIEKDLHACVPALSMFQRMDQNVDAFEAFLDDMERRFALGTLPKRDELGDLIVFRWRAFVLVFMATTTAIFVGAARAVFRLVT